MKKEEMNISKRLQMMAYSVLKTFRPIIHSDNNEHLTANKKNIPFSSLRVENLILFLYDRDKKNRSAEMKMANTIIYPTEPIV